MDQSKYEKDEESVKREQNAASSLSSLELEALRVPSQTDEESLKWSLIHARINEYLECVNDLLLDQRTSENEDKLREIVNILYVNLKPNMKQVSKKNAVQAKTINLLINSISPDDEELSGVAIILLRKLSFLIPNIFDEENADIFIKNVEFIFQLQNSCKDPVPLFLDLIPTIGNFVNSHENAQYFYPLLIPIIETISPDLDKNFYQLFALRNYVRQLDSNQIDFKQLYVILFPFLNNPSFIYDGDENTYEFPEHTVMAIWTVTNSLSIHGSVAINAFVKSDIPNCLQYLLTSYQTQVLNAVFDICILCPDMVYNVDPERVFSFLNYIDRETASKAADVFSLMVDRDVNIDYSEKFDQIYNLIKNSNFVHMKKFIKLFRSIMEKVPLETVSSIPLVKIIPFYLKALQSMNEEIIPDFLFFLYYLYQSTQRVHTEQIFRDTFLEEGGKDVLEELIEYDNTEISNKAQEILEIFEKEFTST